MAGLESADRERLQRFEVVAFGCHETARSLIGSRLRRLQARIETFSFVEYFCLKPLVRSASDGWASAAVCFPFIRRIAEENQFVWYSGRNGALRLQPKSAEMLEELGRYERFVMAAPEAGVGTKTYGVWQKGGPLPYRERLAPERWSEILVGIEASQSEDKDALLVEFGLLGAPWRQSERACLMYAFPIASESIFYGYLILLVAEPGEPHIGDGPGAAAALDDCIGRVFREVTETYLPVLTLLHESLYEEELARRLEGGSALGEAAGSSDAFDAASTSDVAASRFMVGDNVAFLDPLVGSERPHGHGAPTARAAKALQMERALHDLWNRRIKLLQGTQPKDAAAERLRQTLLFARYQVASPGMVRQVLQIMTKARQLTPPRQRGDALPAALVFGTPGSGKDILARMIPLFSDSYFYGEVHTVNMSALKPDMLTGPLLQGLSLAGARGFTGDPSQAGLDGLFAAAARATGGAAGQSEAASFMLDELNSLDVDLQGILLRILEQGEVTPLLGLRREHVRHLIVGIVNENPAEISRETEIRELLTDKAKFGSILGGLLYEVVRRSRRLRDDLYHRLRRQLEVSLPSIDERREDIPILFHAGVARAMKQQPLGIELRVYRLLMDARISWPGNIRQIQSVAQRAVTFAHERGERQITYDSARRALAEEFGKERWLGWGIDDARDADERDAAPD